MYKRARREKELEGAEVEDEGASNQTSRSSLPLAISCAKALSTALSSSSSMDFDDDPALANDLFRDGAEQPGHTLPSAVYPPSAEPAPLPTEQDDDEDLEGDDLFGGADDDE